MIHFPAHRSMGYVLIHTDGYTPDFHGRFKLEGGRLDDVDNPGWQQVAEARGTVEVPTDAYALIEILAEPARDLRPLAACIDTPVQALWLGNTRANDDQLTHVGKLTQLAWLDLQNNAEITDAGIRHLHSLTNLRWLGLHWTGVTDAALPLLASLPRLEYLDIWGCRVGEKAITAFRAAAPDVELRLA